MKNWDIFITEYIAREGVQNLVKAEGTRIRENYCPYFWKKLRGMEHYRDPDPRTPEQKAAAISGVLKQNGTPWFHEIGSGGIYAALWELTEERKCGFDISVGKIPVRQEWIEICEWAQINPYCLISGTEVIIGITDQAAYLEKQLQEQGILLTLIGCTTSDKGRILRQGEKIRYLNRPEEDEWVEYLRRQSKGGRNGD